jgi:hypothetical protein
MLQPSKAQGHGGNGRDRMNALKTSFSPDIMIRKNLKEYEFNKDLCLLNMPRNNHGSTDDFTA